MAVRSRNMIVASVRYAIEYEGEVLDWYDFSQSESRIEDLIAKCDRNPGMTIVAEVYHTPDYKANDEERVSMRSVVYP